MKNKFNYILPVFIETIYKLNQLIDFINDSKENKLEETLIKEMEKENDLNNFLYNNIILIKVNENYEKIKAEKEAAKVEEKKEEKGKSDDDKEEKLEKDIKFIKFKKERIKNFISSIKKSLEIEENKKKEKKEKKNGDNKDKKQIKKEIPKEIKKSLKEELIDILREYELLIVNSDNDILEFNFDNNGKTEKYIGITFDGFILSNKNLKEPVTEKVEEKKEEIIIEEDPFWVCYYCQMENDKNNTFCVFCDKDKKVLPKEKPKEKEKPVEEEKNELGIPDNYSTVLKYNEKKMNNLIHKLKSLEDSPFEEIYF